MNKLDIITYDNVIQYKKALINAFFISQTI